MISTEFMVEHSDWNVNILYTPELMAEFRQVVNVAEGYFDKHGYKMRFSNHFFDQIKLKRGKVGLYTVKELMETIVKILKRGMQFFKGKVPGTSFVFYDPHTYIFIAVVRSDVDNYVATTTVRDTKWTGEGQVIRI